MQLQKTDSLTNPGVSFESELRISPTPVCILLWILGLALCFISDRSTDPLLRHQLPQLSVIMCFGAGVVWLVNHWRPIVGRWTVVIILGGVIFLGNYWLNIPGFLTLSIIPVAMAGCMIGVLAAAEITVAETLLLLLAPRLFAASATQPEIIVSLVAIWTVLGVMYAVYFPVYRLDDWLSRSFQETEHLLEDARDRQGELAQALEDLAHLSRQLALMNERLTALRLVAEDAQKAKAAFVARVSHEFRTPLNMIIGLVNLMVEMPEKYTEEFPPQLFEDLEIVQRNCEHLSSMINDVLDLSQAEAGRLVLHRQEIDLTEIIDSASEVVLPLILKKRLNLQVTIKDGLPKVYCDATRIRQVVINLVSNAARFTAEGKITVNVTEQDQYIVISVTDTGPGIAQDDAKRLFHPFQQASGRMGYDQGGSGLGLSISKQFIELHGGQIWLESELGVGTSFFFKLPKYPPLEATGSPGNWINEEWLWRDPPLTTKRRDLAEQLLKPRVVICDSTGSLYPEFAHFSDEVEVVDTRDLAQATREMDSCPTHVLMLNSAEPEQLEKLLQEASHKIPETPIIGCSFSRPVNLAVKSGARGYLTKPVTRLDLEKAISSVGVPIRRVLLVDDDPEFSKLLARMLYAYKSDLEIIIASGGNQVLRLLDESAPDLVLLDIVMPGVNGWQVLEMINKKADKKEIPVFFVSAQDLTADQPKISPFMMATFGEGLSVIKLLHCSLEFSRLMLRSD
jgi:signal transduction histidine kinase/CheY-like chemotaxis protein